MHIIQSLSIKTSNNIHNIFKNNSSVECSWLRSISSCFNLQKLSLLYIKLVNIIKSLLIGINSSKNVNIASAYTSWMPISWLWRRSVCSMYFVPIVGKKTVLKNIIHCFMPVPSSKNKHWILIHDCWMTKSI